MALILSANAIAQDKQWQLWKNKDGVIVQYKKHNNGIFEVKAEMAVDNVTANDFMALLSDTKTAPQWIENVTQVDVLQRLSESEAIVHTQLNSPWPVADRDMVSYSCYQRISEHQTVLKVSAASGFIAVKPAVIRISELQATWLFTQQRRDDKPELVITHMVYADPGGAIPHWISNKVGLKSALLTMKGLKERLLSKNYQQAEQINQVGKCVNRP